MTEISKTPFYVTNRKYFREHVSSNYATLNAPLFPVIIRLMNTETDNPYCTTIRRFIKPKNYSERRRYQKLDKKQCIHCVNECCVYNRAIRFDIKIHKAILLIFNYSLVKFLERTGEKTACKSNWEPLARECAPRR